MVNIRTLTPDDVPLMQVLLRTFGEAFNDLETYTAKSPSEAYLKQLLGGESFIVLAAMKNGVVVGGIAAYELKKFAFELG
jgi:aminoglycoside 3-N-acetyltransferase I